MAENTQKAGASSAAKFEAEIRKRARPVLSPEERNAAVREQRALEMRLAEARCRDAAKEQTAKADDFAAQAEQFEKGA